MKTCISSKLLFRAALGALAGVMAVAAGAQTAEPAPVKQAASSTAGAPAAARGTPFRFGFGRAQDDSLALTPGQHFRRFQASLFRWNTLFMPLVSATWSEEATSHLGYPDGWRGYEDVYKVRFLDETDGKFVNHFLMPTLFHQEERYRPLGRESGYGARIGHAARHLLETRSDDHSRTEFNYGGLPGAMVIALSEDPFEPAGRRGPGVVMENFGWGVFFHLVGDLSAEFSPEISRLVP